MKFTSDCFKHVEYDEISNLYDSQGKKIKIPTFLDDDEHFMDDDEDLFSSLLPSGCSQDHSIPKINLEHVE